MTTATAPVTAAAQIDQRIRAAHDAYRLVAPQPLETRGRWLLAVAEALTAHADELVALAEEETHLPEQRLRGELHRATFQLQLLAEEIRTGIPLEATIDRADPEWGMGPRPDIRRVNVPLGVVGIFGASNFPFAFSVMGGDSASALASGCAVVHKAHPGHESLARRTAELATDALSDAGAPDGWFSLVEGHDAGLALVDHPLVKAIGFTGSTAGGRALFDRACARPEPIPFYGELGSINPVFVLPRAWATRSEEILRGYTASFTLGMGQFCTKPGLLIVPADADTSTLRDRISHWLAETPSTRMLTPSLREGYAHSLVEVAELDGVAVLLPGDDGEVPGPTVLCVDAERVLDAPEVLHREMFGPASVVIRYRDMSDVMGLAQLLDGQLTATIHGDEADDASGVVDAVAIKAGRVLWNGWPTGVTVSFAQHHGGPYPATTAPSTTSVGTAAIGRFLRPVAYQDMPDSALPAPLREDNPWRIHRRVDGRVEPFTGGGQ